MILIGILAFVAASCSSGSVFELRIGDCFDDAYVDGEWAEQVTDVPMVDCADPHDNEVFAAFELDDTSYPGVSAIEESSDSGCFLRFEPYVGSDYDESRLDFIYLTPTAESWDGGDREVVCVLYAMDLSKLSGSMRDSGE